MKNICSIGNLIDIAVARNLNWMCRIMAYQCVFRVEVAERAQDPGGRVQVLVLLHQLGKPEV